MDDSQHREERIQSYLLGMLSEEEARAVEEQAEKDPAWREMLDAERAVLESLDGLPDETPPQGLTERTLQHVRDSEQADETMSISNGLLLRLAACVCIVIAVAVVLLPALSRSREAARRSSAAGTLKQFGLVFKMYANESPGQKYPPLAPVDGVWVPDLRGVYPEILNDLSLLVDSRLPNASELLEGLQEALDAESPDWDAAHRIVAKSYVYVPWVTERADDLETLGEAHMLLAKNLDADVQVKERVFPRVKEGVERFLITDINNPAGSASAQSDIPIFFERGTDKGANVLFMDGHVEYHKAGDPLLQSLQKALDLLQQ
jgi:prepilin-type processing-associated H-X9-DG protein